MLWELYEPETAALVRDIVKPGMTIIDIGAHIGYFTRIFSGLVGPEGLVYAIEADPVNFALLEKNTKYLANVRRFQIAVADINGELAFYRGEKTGTHSAIKAEFRPQKITVPAARLDDWITKEKIPRIDLIKMDIEGGEPIALKGMTGVFQNNPEVKLILEFNPECLRLGGLNEMEILRELFGLGLEISVIRQSGLERVDANKPLDTEFILTGAKAVNLFCLRPRSNGLQDAREPVA